MALRNVTSREYKIMLRADRFAGEESDLLVSAGRFWDDFSSAIGELVPEVEGSLDRVEKRRTIRFHDTSGSWLRSNDYVFRERRDADSGEREVTLKFRHHDRYVAADRNMDAQEQEQGKTKFEEDIKPPFQKLFSHSTKQPVDDSLELDRLKRPAELFPDLPSAVDDLDDDEPLEVVGGFTAYEIVIEGGSFRARQSPPTDAGCALVVWYDDDDRGTPVVAEFSFKYEDEEEDYSAKVAKRTFDVFECLQSLEAWIDPESSTKTAYVYDRSGR